MKKALVLFPIIILLTLPFTGSIEAATEKSPLPDVSNLPTVMSWRLKGEEKPWWETTALDLDRNRIHDSLDRMIELGEENEADIYLDYGIPPTPQDITIFEEMDLEIICVLSIAKAIGLKDVPISMIPSLAELEGVVMVEQKGKIIFYSDVATPAVKAKESEEYSPFTAWELGYSGEGLNIAIIDTGIDNEHPSLEGKWVGGVDFTKPDTPLTPWDGTYDADDTQGHGTTCSGISTGTSAPEGVYMGTAPSAKLVDIRIGTKIGGGPGEVPYGQDFYDSALRGIEWAIDNKDEQWEGESKENYGIDIISLSWGIYLEEGSSDGSDIYSRLNDRAVQEGIVVCNAAGNEGPDNDGFDGLSASSLAIIIGATYDNNTIPREDDEIASYSSRGPRKDNNDGNPYDELKPDISAPGTDIYNVEPYTGSNPLEDASNNGYEPRGSGTSYATPCIAGIVALILEANPDLTPELVNEILHFTAERRGEPTFPELDPFWNRDFGYGIIDAYEAVRVAEGIEDVTEIDANLQCFIMNISYSITPDYACITGIAWSKDGEVESIEVRIDDGEWVQATDQGNGTWSEWSYCIDVFQYSKGNHTVQARAMSGDKHSLHHEDVIIAEGQGIPHGFDLTCLPGIAIFVLVVATVVYIMLKKGGKKEPVSTEIVEG